MATNGSSSGVIPAIDTSVPEPEVNPLEIQQPVVQEQGPPQAAEEPAPQVDYNKPLTDGADGYAIYSTPEAAEAAMGLGNGGEADQWAQKLTANQRDGVKRYTDGYYSEMNNWMRKLDTSISQLSKDRIASLQHALDKYTLQKPTVTHRGMGPEILGLKANASTKQIVARVKKLMGMDAHITDLGFSSAGAASNKAWSKKVVIHTQTPAGKGIGAFVAGQSQYHSENEFLYNSGTHFKILGVYVQNGQVHINARWDGRDKSTNAGKHITDTPF